MRLLKYPRVVQEEIFGNMEYETIFPVSLTSRNLLKVLKQFNWKPIEITFVFDSNKFQIYFGDSTAPSKSIMKTFAWYHILPEFLYYIEDYQTRQVYTFKVNTGSREKIVIKLYKHILELFQKCRNLKLGARINTSDMNYYVPIPSLEIATFSGVSTDVVTKIMRNHHDLKLLVFEEHPFGETPGGIPDIINIRNLRVVCYWNHFSDYISHFKGVNAYFCGVTIGFQIHEFIDGWLNGKYSDKLNLIHIEQAYGKRFAPELLENYRQKRWDLNRMPLEYQLEEREKYYTKFPGPFKMENAVYVQRESDGKILSLQSTSRIFIGCVWNQEDVII